MIDTRQKLKVIPVLIVSLLCFQCKTIQEQKRGRDYDERKYSYIVKRSDIPPEINADWNKEAWNIIKPLSLDNYMGEKPSHFPETMVKL